MQTANLDKLMAQLDALDKKRDDLKKEIASRKAEIKKLDAQERENAKYIIGGIFLERIGDWRSIDWSSLAEFAKDSEAKLKSIASVDRSLNDAIASMRTFASGKTKTPKRKVQSEDKPVLEIPSNESEEAPL